MPARPRVSLVPVPLVLPGLVLPGLVLPGLVLLAGCATTIPERDRGGVFAEEPGDAWAGVFPQGDGVVDPEILARRDEPRSLAAALPDDFWPSDPRPSLRHPVRVTLDRSPERVLFFRPGYDWGHDRWER